MSSVSSSDAGSELETYSIKYVSPDTGSATEASTKTGSTTLDTGAGTDQVNIKYQMPDVGTASETPIPAVLILNITPVGDLVGKWSLAPAETTGRFMDSVDSQRWVSAVLNVN
jgi:hypothetical protein